MNHKIVSELRTLRTIIEHYSGIGGYINVVFANRILESIDNLIIQLEIQDNKNEDSTYVKGK